MGDYLVISFESFAFFLFFDASFSEGQAFATLHSNNSPLPARLALTAMWSLRRCDRSLPFSATAKYDIVIPSLCDDLVYDCQMHSFIGIQLTVVGIRASLGIHGARGTR